MQIWDTTGTIPRPQRVAAILWLSFLMAGIATGIFFSLIDPMELKYCVDFPEVNRTAAYSVGFLLFWLLTGTSSMLAVFFTHPCADGPEAPHDSPDRN